MTKEETILWNKFLKDYPVRFRRQKVIDNYIVDFYCHKARLVFEIDGSGHYSEKGVEKDERRTEALRKRGLKVYRILNSDILENLDGVCTFIDEKVKENTSE